MTSFGRTIDYLRLGHGPLQRAVPVLPSTPVCGLERRTDQLTDSDLLRVVRVAASWAFRKFRLTGGEPLLRPGLADLVGRMAATPASSVGISTNGLKLPTMAGLLRLAGARTVNVSLDALRPDVIAASPALTWRRC
jgi:cyclic pyranopterin phosphate synthase